MVFLTDGPAWVDNHRSSEKEPKLLPQRDKVSIFASFEIFEFPVVEKEFSNGFEEVYGQHSEIITPYSD